MIIQKKWQAGGVSQTRETASMTPMLITQLNTNLRKSSQSSGFNKSRYASNPMLPNSVTPDIVCKDLGKSLYFGTQQAAIRAYAPEVIGNYGTFWVSNRSMN